MYGFGQNPGRNRNNRGFGGGGGGGRGRGNGRGRGRGNFHGGNHGGNQGGGYGGNFQQPGIQNNGGYGGRSNNNLRQRENEQRDFKQDGIAFARIEQMCAKMDLMEILSGSSDLLKFVQEKGFNNRLNNLWPDVEKQTKFLKVIVAAASATQADMLPLTHAFIDDVLSSKILEKIVEKISQLPYNLKLQKNQSYFELVGYLVKLLLLGFENLPSKMEIHLTKVSLVIATLNGLPRFLNEEMLYNLNGLKERIQDYYTAKTVEDEKEVQARQQYKKRFAEEIHGAPPDDFRKLSLVPTTEDMDIKNVVYLRPAKVDGRYDSDEHYLDVQFRLLREDLIRPLREGIAAYQHGGSKNSDLFVYRNVGLEPAVMHQQTGELVFYANIQILKRMRMNKRLIFGSLVCLSPDDFKTKFLFATVLERDTLKDGKVGLKFEGVLEVNTKRKYCMVESPAFFEAYRHVMTALQTLKENEPIPFSRYLVDVNINTEVPKYLGTQPINFDVIFKKNVGTPRHYNFCNAHNFHHFLRPEHFGMDQSQFGALVNTLQSDLAIIQGPPGTGKTYMGLQIAKLLFHNRQLWQSAADNRPMLVVCYTNHALDQFLEGISKFLNDGIVRVGGRSKNPSMEKYMIHKLRSWKDPNLRFRSKELKTAIEELQEKLEGDAEALKELSSRFAHPKTLNPHFSSTELPYFRSCKNLGTKFENTQICIMSSWLTTYNLEDEFPIDVNVIRYLTSRNIPEIQAKNALLCAYQGYEDFNSQSVYNCLRAGSYGNVSTTQLMRGIEHWPTMRQINDVVRYGFDANTAAEILISCQGNMATVNREITMARNFIGNRKPVASKLPEPTAAAAPGEELTALDFEADDDNNRIIVDNDFMEEIIGTKNKKAKKEKKVWYDPEAIKLLLEHIVNVPAMTNEEAQNVTDIWRLPLQARWRLYQRWISQARNKLKGKLKKIEDEYSEKIKQLQALKTMADVDVMKRAKVVGMTTTGAARHQSTLRSLRPRIVIVEEAAEVLEAHLLASLTIACEHLILIGDHKQLRPNPAVYELAKKYNMDISLFERLVNNNFPYRMLTNQHRICTDISKTLMPHFYKDLQDDPSVLARKPVMGVTKNLMFITHSEPEVSEKDIKSHSNPFEAKFALKLAKYFLQQGYQGSQITVLCTYLDQLLFLRKSAPTIIGERQKITIESVDNYQGEESDIIILSLVRSNNPEGKIGFLNIPNRVCVALSRAREGLFVICNMDFLAKKSEMWKKIQETVYDADALDTALRVKCKMHKKEQLITCGEDFDKKCREGGCDGPCGTRLNCGHLCSRPCHAEDTDHIKMKCMKPCAQTCPAAEKHPCKKRCHEECGACIVDVKKLLPCGHTQVDQCYLEPIKVKCLDKCRKRLPCGHACANLCGDPCVRKCQTLVQKQLLPGCGHFATMKCCEDPATVKCKEAVLKKWPICNHVVNVYCYVDVTKITCPNPCKVALPGCEHLCKGNCGSCRNGRLHIRCTEKCKKILICGHECESKCSNACPPCQKLCQTACGHSQCGKVSAYGEKSLAIRKKAAQADDKDPTSGRVCGDPCPPCAEGCLNKCSHRSCSKKCSDPCDVEPCNERCTKILPCSPKVKKEIEVTDENGDTRKKEETVIEDLHYCIGVCGEECLKICKICNPKEFEEIQEVFFGTEEDEDAKFLQLKDCGHIFEVSGLDQWVESKLPKNDENTIEIVEILCPRCKTSIRRSKRYISLLNQRAADIEQIKHRIRGLTLPERKIEQTKFAAEISRITTTSLNSATYDKILKLGEKLMSEPPTLMTSSWFNSGRNLLKIVKQLLEYQSYAHEKLRPQRPVRAFQLAAYHVPETVQPNLHYCDDIKKKFKIENLSDYLNQEFNILIDRVNMKECSETIIQQLNNEVLRYGFIVDVFVYMNQLYKANNDLKYEYAKALYSTLRGLYGSIEFKDDHEKQLWTTFKTIVKDHPAEGFGISEKERIDIVKALDGAVTKWYKCPNGHMYGIGDCGQAMVATQCPECGTVIGGQNHRLQAGNSDATTEMRQGFGPLHIPDPFVVRFGPEW